MSTIRKLLWINLLCAGIGVAPTTQAGVQQFEASWTVKAFGNACSKADPTPGPYCAATTGPSEFYSNTGVPMGVQCQPFQPRCPFNSTPYTKTKSMGKTYTNFNPLGGSVEQALFCRPWANWRGLGTSARPAKGDTYLDPADNSRPVPPLYRNYAFFTTTTPNAQPYTYSCIGTSTDGFGGPGLVQLGNPVKGKWEASTTGSQRGGFSFAAAPATIPTVGVKGVRATGVVGEVGPIYPYLYSYTYATLRNDAGVFGIGQGPGSFSISYTMGNPNNPPALTKNEALVRVKQGPAKFGGTMRMLGALTTKVCYFRQGGCSLGLNDWRYDAVGASAYYDNTTGNGLPTANAGILGGYIATNVAYYYHTALMQKSTIDVQGARFPWTTGSVTLTAIGRGPHKTLHYGKGFDNRNTTTANGLGTIQLVTPVITRWVQPCCNWETGGVAFLQIKFLPEPQTWTMFVAGISLIAVGVRLRGRRPSSRRRG